MRLFTKKVFSGVVTGPASSSNNYYSLPEFDGLLGAAEKLAVEAVISDYNGTAGTLNVFTQWSNTGTIWVDRAAAIISAFAVNTNSTQLAIEIAPTGGLSRIRINYAGSGSSVNVQLYVCGRAEQNWL